MREQLLAHQKARRNANLFFVAIAGQLDDLHPIAQRRLDRVDGVGGGDEHDLAQVERNIQIVIAKIAILLRIEHFQQRRRRIAAPVCANFVDLVEHKHRVHTLRPPQRLNDTTRHCANVGPPVAADLGLVVHAAKREADELSIGRTGDGLAQTCLANSRRPDQTQDRLACAVDDAAVLAQFLDRQVFEDAFFDLLQTVVVFVEDLSRVRHVDAHATVAAPRQRHEPIQVGPNDRMLRRGAGQSLQATQLALRFGARFIAQRRGRHFLAQLVHFRLLWVFVTQLLVDRFELLAQEKLTLAFFDALLDLSTEFVAEFEQLDLTVEQSLDTFVFGPQPFHLEDLQALLDVQSQTGGDQVQQAPRRILVHGPVHQLVRQKRRDGHQARERFERTARQRFDLRRRRLLPLGYAGDAGHQVRLRIQELDDSDAIQALNPDLLRAVGRAHDVAQAGQCARRVQVLRAWLNWRPAREASSTARSDASRPTASGNVVSGKTSVSLRVRTGYGRRDETAGLRRGGSGATWVMGSQEASIPPWSRCGLW